MLRCLQRTRRARNERPGHPRSPPAACRRRRADRQLLAHGAFAQDQGALPAPKPPGSLATAPYLDSWIRIDADNTITVFTGKAELGQGFKTAFQQIAAEELDVAFDSLKVVTADTKLTANEGYTAGSNSMHNSGVAIQNAAAQVRALLVAEAAKRLDVGAEALRTENGSVIAQDGRRLSYGELVADNMLHVQAQPTSKLKDPASFTLMGKSVPRVDIPAKVTGGAAYVQDLRLPGMVHARVVRPPSYGAQLTDCDTVVIEQMPGVVKVVRDGNFLAVVAEKEFQAVKAMHGAGRGREMAGECAAAETGRSSCRAAGASKAKLPDFHARRRLVQWWQNN